MHKCSDNWSCNDWKKAIVAPGSVVVHDVPDKKIVSGIPAKVIGDVNEKNYNF